MIRVSHLTKRYGAHTAVSDLSFHIEKGAVYGFLGPNGAGKSTTMNILTGCLAATEGEVLIAGHNILLQPMEAKRHIGYLPEIPPVYMDMTPAEYLKFVLEAKGVPRSEHQKQLKDAMEKTGITHMKNRLIRNLSKGYRQRVGIAQALLGNPEIIILDEPTVGLDPVQIIEIRELIRELGKEHTVILSSHILSEVESVCDSLLIIVNGKLLAADTKENLTRHFEGESKLHLLIRGDEEQARAALSEVSGAVCIRMEETDEQGVLHATVASGVQEDIREKVFAAFAKQQVPLLEMRTDRPTLEQMYLDMTAQASGKGEEA